MNLLRAYIYLTGLEGDFATKNALEKELCQKYADICTVSVISVSISGRVQNSLGKPISGAIIEVL